MKKSIKNLAMYIMCFSMFVAVFCAMSIKAEAANVTTGTLGENDGITYTYDADTKTLTITGEDSGLVGGWDSNRYQYVSRFANICEDVEIIKLHNCTLKGDVSHMFANLKSLNSVVLDNVNTTNVTDMSDMFYGCSGLTSLDLSEFDTANVEIMSGMFCGCSGLTSLDVSGFDTSNVRNMHSMFAGCNELTSLDVSSFDTSDVTDMGSLFAACRNLTSLDLSGLDTDNVTNMHSMFGGCSSLTSLDLSGLDTGNVTNMHSMFGGCSSLTSLDLSGLDTGNVTDVSWMFNGCSSLTSLDLSDFNTGKVTDMDLMFEGCSSLTSLDLSNFNTSNVTKMSRMFKNCSSLISLDVSEFDTSNVTDMKYMFRECKSLTSLDLSDFNTGKVTNMEQMFYQCDGLSSLDVSEFDTSNVTNMSSMFASCISLTGLDVSNLNTSNVTDMSSMFKNCSSLISLDVSEFDTSNVTDMSYMFYMFAGDSSLTSLDLSGLDTGNVTDMSWMFAGCSSLTDLDLSGLDTGNVADMSSMFARCSSLTGLDLSGLDTGNVTDMYQMFYRCSSLSSLNISSFDLMKVTSADWAFEACTNLARIETPKTMPETLSINLPSTYVDTKKNQTKKLTKDFCNTTLINVDYLVSEIKLNASSLSIHMGKTGQLTATVSPEKALNKSLTWKSSNTAVAKVDANGKITPVAPGTATITATATDIGGVSASCSVTVTQPVTGIVLSETSLSMKTGELITLTATVSPGNASNKNVEFTSSDKSVAVIEVGKRVRAVGPGTATITATAVDGSGISATCSVTVVRLVSGVSLNKNTLSLNTGKSETLTATVYPEDATIKGVTWESSNTKVATVDANGKVTGVGPGTATITAITKDVTGARDSCEVTVTQLVTGIALNKTTLSLKAGATETLTATISPGNASNKSVTWKSSNTAIATVDANGKVTAVKPGTVTITATAKDGSGKSASCSVTVPQPVTGITLNKTSISIKTGKTYTLTATVSPDNATNKTLTWKSSNTSVATVDSNGKVTAVGPGTATITATAKDGSGKSATCSVTVSQPVTGISLNKTGTSIKVGGSETLTATISPSNASNKAVTWKSSNTAIATVDANGKVAAVAPGTATITATAKDGSGKSASCTVKVMTEQERQVRAFVERMYTIVLGRAAEEQGLNDWAARLMAKEIDGATLVDMFVNSDEFIARNTSDEDYIKILYRAVLGREADAEGLKMWKDMLADDWTRDYILEGLVLSTEFKSICDSYGIIAAFEPTAESQVRSFVKRMYTVVLSRRADAVGLEEWTQRLLNGTANGAQLADGFISSDEFVNRNLSNEKYVKVLYRAFFNREADEGGFNVWMGELAKGVSRRDVMKGFVHSVEFSDLCAAYGIIRGEMQ